MKILHVAPINVAGVPHAMVDMHRSQGITSRLVTLHSNELSFPEDICLNIPLPRGSLASWWRAVKRSQSARPSPIREYQKRTEPPQFTSRNFFENLYFRYDDTRRRPVVERALAEHVLESFDVIHYDGGLDFFRDARVARRWKAEGKRIVCHYMGSDLRVRECIP